MTDDEQAVRQALAALDEALDRGDLSAVLELCTEDVVFIGSGEGEEAIGRSAIAPMFESLRPRVEEFSVSWESIAVDVLGHVALLLADGPAKLITSGRETQFRYRLTGVLVRRDGRWLWRVYHGSEPGAW